MTFNIWISNPMHNFGHWSKMTVKPVLYFLLKFWIQLMKIANFWLWKSIFYVKNYSNLSKNKPESFQPLKASQTFQYFKKKCVWKKKWTIVNYLWTSFQIFWLKSNFWPNVHIWPKSHYRFHTSIIGQKAFSGLKAFLAKKPFLAKKNF